MRLWWSYGGNMRFTDTIAFQTSGTEICISTCQTSPAARQYRSMCGRGNSILTGIQDKWVAAKTRNNLIEARGYRNPKSPNDTSETWKPTMIVDDIPHGFCISRSVTPRRMSDAESGVPLRA